MAETAVGSELSEVPKVTIEEKCSLDMSSYEDLLNVGGDCNGDKEHADEESEEAAGEDNNVNVNVNVSGNGNGRDDPDGSYVFVSRCDSADGNPVDGDRNVDYIHESHTVSESPKVSSLNEEEVEDQVGELNVENGQTVSVEDNCIAASVDISSGSEVINPNGDEDIVLTKDQNSAVILESEVINPNVDEGSVSARDQNPKANLESEVIYPSVDEDSISSKDQNSTAILESESQQHAGEAIFEDKIDPDSAPQQEALEPPTLTSDVSDFGTPQLDDGKIGSGKLSNLESTAESGEIHESDVAVSEVDFVHFGKEKPKVQDNIESTPRVTGSEEMQDPDLVAADCKSTLLEDGKMYSQEHASTMDTSEAERSQESEDKVSDASACKLPEFEVRVVIDETQAKLDSADRDEESSDTQITMPNSAESESESFGLDSREAKVEEQEKIDLREDIKENQKSLLVIVDNVHSGTDKGNEEAKLDNETDLMLERENTGLHELDENDGSSPPSHTEDNISQSIVLNEPSDSSPDKTALSSCSGYAESLPFNVDCVRTEFGIEPKQVENLVPCPTESVKLETGTLSSSVGDATVTSSNDVCAETDSGPSSTDLEGKVSDISCTDSNISSELPIKVTDSACSSLSAVDSLDLQHGANDSQQNGSDAGMKSESEVENSCISKVEMPCNDIAVSHSGVLDGSGVNSKTFVLEALIVQDGRDKVCKDGGSKENLACQETKDTKLVQRDEISTCSTEEPSADVLDEQVQKDGISTCSLEEPSADVLDEKVQKDEISTCSLEEPSADVLDEQSAGMEAMKKPFHFLIKVPRFEDEKLTEQIRHAQLQVDEKTQRRGVIRENIKIIKANYQQLQNNYEAVKSEERAARGLVKSKRQEIDSVQSLINRVKNAMSVDDIDMRIHNMEHMIQHETLPLKEEKQFIREIKQLKQLRDQLSSNIGSQDEVQQALDQRDRIEDQLKVLKKELDRLKEKVSKAEAIAEAARKKCSEEGKKLKELNAQYKAADDIRQEAYTNFQNLRGQLNEKQSGFRAYKDESAAAKKYASKGDKEAVHRLCVNQVETIMELWNKNDKFRDEYIRCNTRSTVRRFGTVDGRALGPDEEPAVLPAFVDERINKSVSTHGKANSESQILTQEQEKQMANVESQEIVNKSLEKVAEQMEQMLKTKKPGKSPLRNGLATFSNRDEIEEVPEVEHKQTKEEQESARKEEELRKEMAAAKRKEQRRLEEKAKAREAFERKRRNAEKAQIRAELRAQKEAEQKEKEREKRAKKKERKKAAAADAPDGNKEGESLPTSETPQMITNEPETKEGPSTMTKKPQKPYQFSKQSKTKSIPPPLRNKGKRKMQQWIWIILTVLVVLALFLLGNIGFYSNLGRNLRNRTNGL